MIDERQQRAIGAAVMLEARAAQRRRRERIDSRAAALATRPGQVLFTLCGMALGAGVGHLAFDAAFPGLACGTVLALLLARAAAARG